MHSQPSSKLENWKYSKVEGFLKLGHLVHKPDSLSALQDLPPDIESLISGYKQLIVFYNGEYVETLSNFNFPSGAKFQTLSGSMEKSEASNYFENEILKQPTGGIELSALDLEENLDINIVYLYGNRMEGQTRPARINILNKIKSSGKSSLKIFETHIAINDIEFSLNQSTQIKASDDSTIERVKSFWLGEESYVYDQEDIEVTGQAGVLSFVIQLGGKWSRLEQNAKLLTRGSSYTSLGAYLLSGSSHCDMTTNIHHQAGSTISEQLFKGVLTDKARSAFSGGILISEDAQKSSTSQLNQNVVLGDGAEADSRPKLEVYADDVTASHGATVGGLNKDEIFYLQSRGITKTVATEMIANAFVSGLADKITSKSLKKRAAVILKRGFSKFVKSALEDL